MAGCHGCSTCGLVYADVTDRTTLLRNAEQRYGTDPEGIYLALQDVVNDATLPEDELQGQLLWHFARACHDMAAELSNKEEKKRLIYEGYAAAERAVVYAPQVSAAHKWMAIMISDVGDFEGLKAKLLKSYTMKEHFQKAIELNPKDATSRHLLGVWCFSFADLPWYQRKAAAAVFATPPSSTYEEALANFEQAEATEPGFYTKNAYYLGLTYARLGRKEEARRWLETCLEMPANNADDKEAHTLAAAALKQV
ncbi:uncharacterized protein MONBRDRAFT_33982 [Monosiga brevicollis MX1]|uniref:Regulator of microtubule dynamics protein 1 n=1 Tax=Monosiga brevicollis TaxID=81824 RepID=A9V8X2_MONBE|nr:uncharacterized protein MONBRDRAFT_33982 [Monosiga brevicollis MX1]EDQ85949.1 predicted protein [Monosiga brevicollis MX1]|eukprot:XP_001749143.1 hypothetical protein [Monosiga brevicollis MX1]